MFTPQSKYRSFPRLQDSPLKSDSKLFTIPSSPLMKKLGWGTGVSVYCYNRNKGSEIPKTPTRWPRRDKPASFQSPWAIKKVNKKAPPIVTQRLKEEAELLKNLCHPNIVGFRQVSTTPDGRMAMAMELGGDGSLMDRIEGRLESSSGAFPAVHVFRVGLQVSRALAYLHHERYLLHGDIKSANVLVRGRDFDVVKICDFGVCQRLDENMEMIVDDDDEDEAEYVGTEPWCAKEVFDGGVISNKTDVFAFGLTLWEMWTLKVPHILEAAEDEDDEVNEQDENVTHDDDDDGKNNCTFGTRPPMPEDILDSSEHSALVDIFLVCTMEDSKKRPTAQAIVKAFENMKADFIETPTTTP